MKKQVLHKTIRERIRSELSFETSRSGGKGGQHVNKTESRVTLVFNVKASSVLTFSQKERIERLLENRINQGLLRMSADSDRSQFRNKSIVTERFFDLLEDALKERAERKPTKPSKAAKESRIKAKKERQEKKNLRKKLRNYDF